MHMKMSYIFNTTIHITCMLWLSTTYYWPVSYVSTCIHVVKLFLKICMTNNHFLSAVSYADQSQPPPCVVSMCVYFPFETQLQLAVVCFSFVPLLGFERFKFSEENLKLPFTPLWQTYFVPTIGIRARYSLTLLILV